MSRARKTAPRVVVKQTPDAEVPTEVLAESIVAISQGVKKLRAGRLNETALVLLLQHACKGVVSRNHIKCVLDALQDLERLYVRRAV